MACNGNALVSHWTDRKAYEKMVRQIDQAFYGVRPLISDNRDVDDSEMDDRIATDVDERHPSIAQLSLSTRAVTLALDLFLSAVLYLRSSLQHPCLSAKRAIAFLYS